MVARENRSLENINFARGLRGLRHCGQGMIECSRGRDSDNFSMWDLLLTDCHAATMTGDGYGAIHDAVIAIADGHIAWIGSAKDRPKNDTRETRSLNGAWVTPGLVDCHTHLVFAGNRATEWRCVRRAQPTKRSRAPAAEYFPPCARHAPRPKASSSRNRCRVRRRWRGTA